MNKLLLQAYYFLITVPSAVIGYYIGYTIDYPILLSICLGLLTLLLGTIGIGLRKNSQYDFSVIQRFGTQDRVVHEGLYVLTLPGIIDSIVENPIEEMLLSDQGGSEVTGNLKFMDITVFPQNYEEPTENIDTQNVIDFTCGISTPADVHMSLRIGDRNAPTLGTSLTDADKRYYEPFILRYAYAHTDLPMRMREVAQSYFKPYLESMSYEQAAQEAKGDMWNYNIDEGEKEATKDSLEQLGFVLNPHKSFVLADFALPTTVKELRRIAVEAKQNAKAQITRTSSQSTAINDFAIKGDMSKEEAREFYLRDKSLDTLSKTGSNVTIITSDVKHLKTMGIEPKQGEN